LQLCLGRLNTDWPIKYTDTDGFALVISTHALVNSKVQAWVLQWITGTSARLRRAHVELVTGESDV